MNPSVQHDDAHFLDLLRRWQSGHFTRADEQELRTLTASDDFRREAMEGFMSLPETEHEARLTALRARLRQRVGGGRRVALPQIWAVAAALLMLLTAIWFFPKWNEKDAAPVAQTQVESEEKITPMEVAPAAESPDDDRFAENSSALKSAPSTAGASKSATDGQVLSVLGAGVADGEIAAVEEAEYVADDVQPAFSAPPPKPNAAPSQNKVLDKAASESKKDDVVSGMREGAKAKKSKETPQTDSIWHETDRKPDMDAARKEARDEAPQQSEPAEGWDAFSDYLRLNARLTTEARNRNVSGTVRIQFTVNENDEPQNFFTIRSLGYGCDEEAIRLIKSWEWVRGKYPTVTVDVAFVR